MSEHFVGRVSEIPPGSRRIVDVAGRSIGVFNVAGKFYALRNICPHQLAPLCRGKVTGTALPSLPGEYKWAREGEVIRCPWHGWEFDLTTGQSVFNPHRLRVKTYQVTIEIDGEPTVVERSADDEDPTVETYPVTVEEGDVILHV